MASLLAALEDENISDLKKATLILFDVCELPQSHRSHFSESIFLLHKRMRINQHEPSIVSHTLSMLNGW
jgi:hypothetical protein